MQAGALLKQDLCLSEAELDSSSNLKMGWDLCPLCRTQPHILWAEPVLRYFSHRRLEGTQGV